MASGSGFWWVPRDGSDNELASSEVFATQGDAEAWLADGWEQLVDDGALEVELVNNGRVVYRMSLERR
jgi:hypothetical protein